MNRRRDVTFLTAGTTGATAGYLDGLESVVEDVDVEEADASDEVHGVPETFGVDVRAVEELFVSTTVTGEGSGGQGEMALYDPAGDEVDGARFSLSVGTSRALAAGAGGTHDVDVDPREDRQVTLGASISVVEQGGRGRAAPALPRRVDGS